MSFPTQKRCALKLAISVDVGTDTSAINGLVELSCIRTIFPVSSFCEVKHFFACCTTQYHHYGVAILQLQCMYHCRRRKRRLQEFHEPCPLFKRHLSLQLNVQSHQPFLLPHKSSSPDIAAPQCRFKVIMTTSIQPFPAPIHTSANRAAFASFSR